MKNLKNLISFLKEVIKKPHGTIKNSEKVNIFDNIIFIVCSIASAFINLIFIANLTKSPYTLGTVLTIPAAVFLALISIALDLSKMNHAMKINALTELVRELENKEWVGNVKKIKNKWKLVYSLYVILSIFTSISLSTISIGAGISRNANALAQITTQIDAGEKLISLNESAKTINQKSAIADATSTKEKDARDYAIEKTEEVENFIEKIRPIVFAEYEDDDEEVENPKTAEQKREEALLPYESERQRINNILKNAGWRKRTFDELAKFDTSGLQNDIKNKRLEFLSDTTNNEATLKLNQFTQDNDIEIRGWLDTLNALNLLNPKSNEIIKFDTDENKPEIVLAKSAVTLLKALKVDVENDSGDIGSSSKIFMQVGSWVESIGRKDNENLNEILERSPSSGSLGVTEISMMLTLLFLSLLCELAINQFSPQPKLTRKLVGKFRRYFPKDFDINEFIFEVSKEKYKALEMDSEEFDFETSLCADIAIKSELTLKKMIEARKKESKIVKPKEEIKKEEVKEVPPQPIRKVREIKPKEPEQKKESNNEDALKAALEGLIKKVEQE